MGNRLRLLVANSLKAEPPYAGQAPVTLSFYGSTGVKNARGGENARGWSLCSLGRKAGQLNSPEARQLGCEGQPAYQ